MNKIFMIAIEDKTSQYDHTKYSKISEQSWQHYCNRHNIEFEVIRYNLPGTENGKAIWNKEAVIANYCSNHYEKIGMVDCDTIVKWDAPNIFDQYSTEFCGVNDIADINWLLESIKNYKEHFFPGFDINIAKYINAGVIFFHRQHINIIFKEFFNFYLENKEKLNNWNLGGGREQTLLNWHLQKNDVDIKLLTPEWNLFAIHKKNMFNHNWQLDEDMTEYFVKYAYVWHFTGFPIEDRERIMSNVWEKYKILYQ